MEGAAAHDDSAARQYARQNETRVLWLGLGFQLPMQTPAVYIHRYTVQRQQEPAWCIAAAATHDPHALGKGELRLTHKGCSSNHTTTAVQPRTPGGCRHPSLTAPHQAHLAAQRGGGALYVLPDGAQRPLGDLQHRLPVRAALDLAHAGNLGLDGLEQLLDALLASGGGSPGCCCCSRCCAVRQGRWAGVGTQARVGDWHARTGHARTHTDIPTFPPNEDIWPATRSCALQSSSQHTQEEEWQPKDS